MIILQLGGGLGNQMFEYCFAKWVQNKTNEKIVFDCNDIRKNEIEDRKFALMNFSIDEICVGNKLLMCICEFLFKVIYFVLNIKYDFIELTDHDYYNILSCYGLYKSRKIYDGPLKVKKEKRLKFISGNFQNEFYASQIPNIKEIFKINCKLNSSNREIYEEIKSCNSICVHIRRGDYLAPQYSDLNICTIKYYIEAMEYIENKTDNPVFYIFSNTHDDIEWIKANIKFKDNWNVKYVDENNEDFVELFLMKSCHSFIISNSTFSWWAQYLAEYEEKIVVAPSIWNKESIYINNSKKIYMSNWHLINV